MELWHFYVSDNHIDGSERDKAHWGGNDSGDYWKQFVLNHKQEASQEKYNILNLCFVLKQIRIDN